MKIISYPYKNHLLDDFQEVLKSYKEDGIISDPNEKREIENKI